MIWSFLPIIFFIFPFAYFHALLSFSFPSAHFLFSYCLPLQLSFLQAIISYASIRLTVLFFPLLSSWAQALFVFLTILISTIFPFAFSQVLLSLFVLAFTITLFLVFPSAISIILAAFAFALSWLVFLIIFASGPPIDSDSHFRQVSFELILALILSHIRPTLIFEIDHR